jgi:hypothetical protein
MHLPWIEIHNGANTRSAQAAHGGGIINVQSVVVLFNRNIASCMCQVKGLLPSEPKGHAGNRLCSWIYVTSRVVEVKYFCRMAALDSRLICVHLDFKVCFDPSGTQVRYNDDNYCP